MLSHPSWVCGLKRLSSGQRKSQDLSHPSWVCGLKQTGRPLGYYLCRSHPSWVCGLKLIIDADGILARRHTLRGCVD